MIVLVCINVLWDLVVEVWSATPLHKHLRFSLSAGSAPARINWQALSFYGVALADRRCDVRFLVERGVDHALCKNRTNQSHVVLLSLSCAFADASGLLCCVVRSGEILGSISSLNER